jgi:DNA repair exonuclease SbcCD ATPase subunit
MAESLRLELDQQLSRGTLLEGELEGLEALCSDLTSENQGLKTELSALRVQEGKL